MKSIVLLGATGMIGQRILMEGLSRGHRVTAVTRETSRTGEHRQNLDYRVGDIFKPETIAAAAVDHDVVVSAYGPGPGDAHLVLKAAHSLVDAMTRVEPIRLIVVNGAGSLEVKPGLQLVDTPDFPPALPPSDIADLRPYRQPRSAPCARAPAILPSMRGS